MEAVKPLNIIIIVLSIYVLLQLLISSFFRPPHEIAKLLDYIDDAICIVFLVDFMKNFYQAENKLKFMKWGWIDLVSSIPTFGYLRAGRAFKLIRLLRIMRAFRSAKHLINHIYNNKTQGAFTTVAIIAILTIIFSAISILQVETDPESNIKTAEDALWWSYVTVTTVGYGDKFPVTTEGRLIATVLMTVGVGLFGTFTAFLASWFVEDKQEAQNLK